MEILDKLKMVKPGMTREEVSNILGPNTGSLTPKDFRPVGDSYRYKNKDGQERYIHVWYRSGKVERTSTENITVASIALKH